MPELNEEAILEKSTVKQFEEVELNMAFVSESPKEWF
jgi:hypothetical protein